MELLCKPNQTKEEKHIITTLLDYCVGVRRIKQHLQSLFISTQHTMEESENTKLPVENEKLKQAQEMANELVMTIPESILKIELENNYKFSETEKIAVYASLIDYQAHIMLNKSLGNEMNG